MIYLLAAMSCTRKQPPFYAYGVSRLACLPVRLLHSVCLSCDLRLIIYDTTIARLELRDILHCACVQACQTSNGMSVLPYCVVIDGESPLFQVAHSCDFIALV